MSTLRSLPVWAKVAFAALLALSVTPACDEGGEKLPARCSDTNGDGEVDPLPLDDLGAAGVLDANNPCLTEIGHSLSFVDDGSSTPPDGTNSGGNNTGGTESGQGGAGAGGS